MDNNIKVFCFPHFEEISPCFHGQINLFHTDTTCYTLLLGTIINFVVLLLSKPCIIIGCRIKHLVYVEDIKREGEDCNIIGINNICQLKWATQA